MYLSVGIVFALILVMATPFIWTAWWLLGERASDNYAPAHAGTFTESRRGVA